MLDLTDTIDQDDQADKLYELLFSFDDLVNGKGNQVSGLQHLILQVDPNSPPDETTQVFVMRGQPLIQVRLTENTRPPSPVIRGIKKRELSIEAPKGKIFDLPRKCGLPDNHLSQYAMQELAQDLRFERIIC